MLAALPGPGAGRESDEQRSAHRQKQRNGLQRGALATATVGSAAAGWGGESHARISPANPCGRPTRQQSPWLRRGTGQQHPGHRRTGAEGERGKEHVDIEKASNPDGIPDMKTWRDTPQSFHPASLVHNWGN